MNGKRVVNMSSILQTVHHRIHQLFQMIAHSRQWALVGLVLAFSLGILPSLTQAKLAVESMTKELAVQLGEEFGIIVGEVDEEIQEMLGLEKAGGVVVFEVIGGKPADLAGIKSRSLIKEVNSVEIFTLEDFGQALREALRSENFSLATYEPPGIDDQGISGGINFHFVRIEKS